MSGERVDGIDPHVLKVEVDLFSGGFDPYVASEQDGFWVEKQGHSVLVWWLPLDFSDRVGSGGRYRFEEQDEASRMHLAYASHLEEVAEEEAKLAYQRPLEEYEQE